MAADQTTPSDAHGEPGPEASSEEIQADIDKTRRELGQTLEALAAKADVKGQAQQKASEAKDRLTDKAVHTRDVIVEKAAAAQSATRGALIDDAGPGRRLIPAAVFIGAAVAVIGIVVWWRR